MKTFSNFCESKSLILLAKDAGIDLKNIDLDQLKRGIKVEKEHDGGQGKDVDVVKSKSDLLKIAVAHLREKPDYYTRLAKIE